MAQLPRTMLTLLAAAVVLLQSACGGAGSHHTNLDPPETTANQLSSADVQSVIQNAATAVNTPFVIAVTDRGGNILAIFRKAGAPPTATGDFGATISSDELAVGLARTASFFSNNQAPLSSRTVRFISGIHFPADIAFTGSALLALMFMADWYLPKSAAEPARAGVDKTIIRIHSSRQWPEAMP